MQVSIEEKVEGKFCIFCAQYDEWGYRESDGRTGRDHNTNRKA